MFLSPQLAPSSAVRISLSSAPGSSFASNGSTSVPAPAPAVAAAAISPPSQIFIDNSQLSRPTHLFTLIFFAIALVVCVVLGIFITIILIRRRRERFQYLQRRRLYGVGMTSRFHGQRGHGNPHHACAAREIPPLIEGVLVLHPDGEEQIAYAPMIGKAEISETRTGTDEESPPPGAPGGEHAEPEVQAGEMRVDGR